MGVPTETTKPADPEPRSPPSTHEQLDDRLEYQTPQSGEKIFFRNVAI